MKQSDYIIFYCGLVSLVLLILLDLTFFILLFLENTNHSNTIVFLLISLITTERVHELLVNSPVDIRRSPEK